MEDTTKTTIYCWGDKSNRSLKIDMDQWIKFLDYLISENSNYKCTIFDSYRTPREKMDLASNLYDKLEKWQSPANV